MSAFEEQRRRGLGAGYVLSRARDGGTAVCAHMVLESPSGVIAVAHWRRNRLVSNIVLTRAEVVALGEWAKNLPPPKGT
jgi:hypothetical protein